MSQVLLSVVLCFVWFIQTYTSPSSQPPVRATFHSEVRPSHSLEDLADKGNVSTYLLACLHPYLLLVILFTTVFFNRGSAEPKGPASGTQGMPYLIPMTHTPETGVCRQ